LTWSDRSSDETGFTIERSLAASDGFTEIATAAANATSYVDATVLKKTTYFYRVRAAAGPARSGYSNVAAVAVK
jgi:titin